MSVLLRLPSLFSPEKRFELDKEHKGTGRLTTEHRHSVALNFRSPAATGIGIPTPSPGGVLHATSMVLAHLPTPVACDLRVKLSAQRSMKQHVRSLSPQVGTSTLAPPHPTDIKVR